MPHQVADHGDLRMTGDREVGTDTDSSGSVPLSAGSGGDCVGDGRCPGSRGPDHGPRGKADGPTGSVPDLDAPAVPLYDDRARMGLDS